VLLRTSMTFDLLMRFSEWGMAERFGRVREEGENESNRIESNRIESNRKKDKQETA